ncbi:ATP phosphoribosyltransferase [Microbaculum marinum]|uniref:ATP phosphoribosyltransferase n=1 Tax=Microbaculum marinum TaxID=1764581 RepID=A0AAW9RQZ3_9HYPH
MSAPLLIAVPSKGRLQENADAFFARAGLAVTRSRGHRDYRGAIAGIDGVEVLFLSASEITRELSAGAVHLGITGEDLVREVIADADDAVELVTPLGFGGANVVVAVPQMWIDVRTMADLDDVAQGFHARHGRRLRVATKYVNLTRKYFAEHSVGDYVIVESLGATEGAPASGAADLIVDITTTGATLAANALKVLDDGVILMSQANLVAALRAEWDEPRRRALRILLDRIAAEERARLVREVRASVPGDGRRVFEEAAGRFGCEAPFGVEKGGPLLLHCPTDTLYGLIDYLREADAEAVTVGQVDYVFQARNPLYDKVVSRLGGQP